MPICKCFKLKKSIIIAFFAIILAPSAALACNPMNPVCMFQKLLKSCPGMPVFDFASLPAIIPHTPAALMKEGHVKIKEVADSTMQKVRSVKLPSLSDLVKPANLKQMLMAKGEEIASLQGLKKMNLDDPLDIAKGIEIFFLKPGWESGSDAEMTAYDESVMAYQRNQFFLNNLIEMMGVFTVMDSKMEELMVAAENVQKKISSAEDVNQSLRASYDAKLLQYQLMIIDNQLLASELQLSSAKYLRDIKPVLDRPVLGKM